MELPLEIEAIKSIIPHRPPFLLVDRIVELEPGVRAVGLKAVTADEWFFTGHFPGYMVMPGVLIVEALAQTGSVALLSVEENHGKIAFFAGIKDFKFRRQVRPGDTLRLEVEVETVRGPVGSGTCTARLGDSIAAEGRLMFAVKEP